MKACDKLVTSFLSSAAPQKWLFTWLVTLWSSASPPRTAQLFGSSQMPSSPIQPKPGPGPNQARRNQPVDDAENVTGEKFCQEKTRLESKDSACSSKAASPVVAFQANCHRASACCLRTTSTAITLFADAPLRSSSSLYWSRTCRDMAAFMTLSPTVVGSVMFLMPRHQGARPIGLVAFYMATLAAASLLSPRLLSSPSL